MSAARLLPFVLALAACQPPQADNAAAPAPATGDALNRIAALPPGQQQLVLFRAIRDAGQDCQDITKNERLPDQDGQALWRITCRGGGQFAVAISTSGIANVTTPRP